MKPYRPSGKVPIIGYLKMSLAVIPGGLIIGSLTFLISPIFYPVGIAPFLIGIAGAYLISKAVSSGKVRNPLIAGIFALLAGFSIYGSTKYLNYTKFQYDMVSEIKKDIANEDVKPDEIINIFLKSKTNSDGFIGFIKYKAQKGISFGRIGSRGNNFGEFGTWTYWLIELSIIQLILVLTAMACAGQHL
jgi:hypothetical protein